MGDKSTSVCTLECGWSDKISDLAIDHHTGKPEELAPILMGQWNPEIDGMSEVLLSGCPQHGASCLHFPSINSSKFNLKDYSRLLASLRKEGVDKLLLTDPQGVINDTRPYILSRKLGFKSVWLRLQAQSPHMETAFKLLEKGLLQRLLITIGCGTEKDASDFKIPQQLQDKAALQIFMGGENWKTAVEDSATLHSAKLILLSLPSKGLPGKHFPETDHLVERMTEFEEDLPQDLECVLFEMPYCAVSCGEPPYIGILRNPPFVDYTRVYKTDDGSILRRRFEWPGRHLQECQCNFTGSCVGFTGLAGHKEKRRGIYPYLQRLEGLTDFVQGLVRPVLHCNQSCHFCWVEHGYKMPKLDHIVREVVRQDIDRLLISGGEPTLYPQLPELIHAASQKGMDVELQTNAVRLSDKDFCRKIVESGLSRAFASFHSHIPEKYDLITGMEGGYAQGLAGIHNLLASRISVDISHVIHRTNMDDLPQFVEFIKREFSNEFELPSVTFSFVMDSPAMPEPEMMPRFYDMKPMLIETLEWCLENGIRFNGLQTPCGVPYCILNGDMRYYPVVENAYPSEPHRQPPQCNECKMRGKCFGPRKLYVKRYGAEEFVPIG